MGAPWIRQLPNSAVSQCAASPSAASNVSAVSQCSVYPTMVPEAVGGGDQKTRISDPERTSREKLPTASGTRCGVASATSDQGPGPSAFTARPRTYTVPKEGKPVA